MQISESWPSRPGPRPVSRLNYLDWEAQSDVFDSIAAVSWGSATIGGADHPIFVDGALVVRTLVPTQTLEDPIRKSVAAVDRDQALADVKTIDQLEAEDVAPDRLRSILLTAFAAVAVVLTALGLYGVIAHGVLQRAREIGIRAALGASTWRILRLVLGQGLAAIAIGLAVGVAGSIAVLRLLRAFLFGVGAADPGTLAAVAGVMAVVALIACYLPARQATRVDPLIALKTE